MSNTGPPPPGIPVQYQDSPSNRPIYVSPRGERDSRGLLPLQQCFVSLLAVGCGFKQALDHLGLDRQVLKAWYYSESFRIAAREARFDGAALLRDQRKYLGTLALAHMGKLLRETKDDRLRLECIKEINKVCGFQAPEKHEHMHMQMSENEARAIVSRMERKVLEQFHQRGMITDAQFEEMQRKLEEKEEIVGLPVTGGTGGMGSGGIGASADLDPETPGEDSTPPQPEAAGPGV